MTSETGVQERVIGALMGLAIGDALGAPVEYLDAKTIATAHPKGVRDYIDQPSTGFRPGQGTDDTEMAFLVAASIIENGALNMDDLATRLVAWGQNNPALGPSTGTGIAAMAMGVEWNQAGQTEVASSGCLPRCAPLALFTPRERIVDDTVDCCKPTHRHPLAIAATVAQNLILERLIQGIAWDEAVAVLDGAGPQFDELAAIRAALDGKSGEPGAVDVFAEALQCLANAPDAEEAIVASVSLGGDTDTRAAVAGALAGARWGVSALPQRWIDGCEAGAQAHALGCSLAKLRLN